jgi:hypothetical protein
VITLLHIVWCVTVSCRAQVGAQNLGVRLAFRADESMFGDVVVGVVRVGATVNVCACVVSVCVPVCTRRRCVCVL